MATFRNNTGVRVTRASLAGMQDDLRMLADLRVMVGVPDENADREADETGKQPDLTNAAIAYIHDTGAPEQNIPQREFMRPGILAVQDQLEEKLAQTMRAVLRGGGPDKVEQGLSQVGIIAAVSIQKFINDGVPPPLSAATLRQRMRNKRKNGGGARKGAAQELDRRWDGQAPSVEFAKPLVDTAQLRNSITYAIRSRKKKGA